MRFLLFVTSDAEYEKVTTLLKAAAILYETKTVRTEDGKAQGYILSVVEEDFDAADELLSTPRHDISFSLLEDNRMYRDEEQKRDGYKETRRRKELRWLARLTGIGGLLYMLYQWFMRS